MNNISLNDEKKEIHQMIMTERNESLNIDSNDSNN